jgi:hypothetical protein
MSTLFSAAESAATALQQSAWRWESWLHTWNLNRSTVLDYFKHSDFYDRTCNNEIAIMQAMNAESLKSVAGSFRQARRRWETCAMRCASANVTMLLVSVNRAHAVTG